MANQRLLFDCEGRQSIPGMQSNDFKILPSGKVFNYISEDEENQAIYRKIKENCDIRFLKEQEEKGFNLYPVPVVWFFAYDSCGNYFGTLNGMGNIEEYEFPVVFINNTNGAHGKIAENMKEFLSLANYYPYWRNIIEYEQQGIPYNLKEMEKENVEEPYFERQKKIGEAFAFSKDPDAIKLLIDRIHNDSGFVVYKSKSEAEKENEFITI